MSVAMMVFFALIGFENLFVGLFGCPEAHRAQVRGVKGFAKRFGVLITAIVVNKAASRSENAVGAGLVIFA